MTDTANQTNERGLRKTQQGVVLSSKMDKTLTVGIERTFPHTVYQKFVRRRVKLHVHDEKNEGCVGDVVDVMETRPLSKLKRWRLVKIVRRGTGAGTGAGTGTAES